MYCLLPRAGKFTFDNNAPVTQSEPDLKSPFDSKFTSATVEIGSGIQSHEKIEDLAHNVSLGTASRDALFKLLRADGAKRRLEAMSELANLIGAGKATGGQIQTFLGFYDKDPESALAWVKQLSSDQAKDSFLKGLVEDKLTLEAPFSKEQLTTLAYSITDPGMQSQALRSLSTAIIESTGVLAALDWVLSLDLGSATDFNSRSGAVQEVINAAVEGSPELAMSIAEKFSAVKDISPYLQQSLVAATERAPATAISVVDKLNGEDRYAAYAPIFATWRDTNYNTMGEWLAAHKNHDAYDIGVFQYIKAIQSEPEPVQKWVSTIKNPEFRQSIVKMINEGMKLPDIMIPPLPPKNTHTTKQQP